MCATARRIRSWRGASQCVSVWSHPMPQAFMNMSPVSIALLTSGNLMLTAFRLVLGHPLVAPMSRCMAATFHKQDLEACCADLVKELLVRSLLQDG